MIPPFIHVVWTGSSAAVPVASLEQWRQHHPRLQVRLWDSPTLAKHAWATGEPQLALLGANRQAYEHWLRFDILRRFGGVLVEAGASCPGPLPQSLLDGGDFCFSAAEAADGLSAAVVAARVASPVVAATAARLADLGERAAGTRHLGDLVLTEEWFKAGRSGLTVYPANVFPIVRADRIGPQHEVELRQQLPQAEPTVPVVAPTDSVARNGASSGGEPLRFRVVVATDWTSAALPLTVMESFSRMLPTDAPADLVFAVPEEPTDADVACVQTLLAGLSNPDRIPSLRVESFAEVLQQPVHAALVPSHDPDVTVVELAEVLRRLHEVAVVVGRGHRYAPAPPEGGNDSLRKRLDEFAARQQVTVPA